jgi:ketosteroid isomerase-like protein
MFMKLSWVLGLVLIAGCGQVSSTPPAATQTASGDNAELEKVLWDVNQQWLCSGPYTKSYKDCVQFRAKYWADQFFEVIPSGEVLNKEEMVATQAARIPDNPDPRLAPYPDAFKLRAVYGDFAMATDHTYFKSKDKNGNIAFASNSKVLRLFVKENGTWRPAAAGLVPIIMPNTSPNPVEHLKSAKETPDPALEKQLAEIDRAWMDSSDMKKRVVYVTNLFTDQWFEILGWDPTGNTIKSTTVQILSKFADSNAPPGVVQDQFHLQAVYGGVALATDRRTRTWKNDKGQVVKTPHRSVLVFVKQNGEWKSAGASLTPILTPE